MHMHIDFSEIQPIVLQDLWSFAPRGNANTKQSQIPLSEKL